MSRMIGSAHLSLLRKTGGWLLQLERCFAGRLAQARDCMGSSARWARLQRRPLEHAGQRA